MIRKNVEILTGVILLLLAVALRIYTQTQPWYTPEKSIVENSSFFPVLCFYCLGVFGIGEIIHSRYLPLSNEIVTLNYKGLLLIALWVVYGFAIEPLGFLAASFIALLLSQLLWGERRKGLLLSISVVLPLVIYITLGKMLNVSFPQGVIPF